MAEEVTALCPEARIAVLSSDLFGSARALKEQIALIAEGTSCSFRSRRSAVTITSSTATGREFAAGAVWATAAVPVESAPTAQLANRMSACLVMSFPRVCAARSGADRPGSVARDERLALMN